MEEKKFTVEAATGTNYRVVWPLGKWSGQVISLAPPIHNLEGKTIGVILNDEAMREALQELLIQMYPDVKLIPPSEFAAGYTGTAGEQFVQINILSKLIKEKGCDAVITGVGI
jgi:hypothetical protein